MTIKRPLLLLTGGFVLGEVLILQRSVVMELLPAAALAASGCALVRLASAARTGGRPGSLLRKKQIRRKGRRGRSLWLWLLPLFLCAGMMRAQQARGQCEAESLLGLDGKMAEARGKVSGISLKDDWTVLVLEDVGVRTGLDKGADGKLERLQVYVETEDAERGGVESTDAKAVDGKSLLRIGSQVRVRGECLSFEPSRNPGEFDSRMYYRSLKLNYRMFAVSFEIVEGDRGTIWDRYRDGLRRISVWASDRLEDLAGPEDAGIFRAALLGDRTGLPENVRDMYQRNGIAHLLAVSGLHLSLVSLAVYGLIRRLGAGYGAAGLTGGAVLFGYALMTGASPSVIRALIMALCGFLAAYLGRTYDLMSALSLSALWLLWDSPYLLFQAGVQLSFGAIIGLGGLAPCLRQERGTEKEKEEAADRGEEPQVQVSSAAHQGYLLSVSMQFVTLPLVLFHFFQYPLYGIFLNLLAVPLMGIVVGSGAFGIALGCLSLEAGRFAAASGCAVLDWYEWCCRMFERLPGSSVILGRPELWQIGVYYGILAAVAWMAGGKRFTSLRPFAMAFLFVFLLPLPVRGLSVTFLDVGQGDGVCLRTRQTVVLVDGGSSDQKKLGENRLEPFLKSCGIRTVDYWVVSHGDSDHVSGLAWMMEESADIAIRNLVLPAAGYGEEAYERLEELAESRGTAVFWMEREDGLLLGQLMLTCIYPEETASHPLPESADRNEHSLALRADYGGFHMLLTGDMTGDGERRLIELLKKEMSLDVLADIQALKVAHHGSRFSNTEDWLDVIQPRWAFVSCGEDNRYGHPHGETLERLRERGIPVFNTAESGAVILETDGKEIRLETWLPKP